ncbi:hypothetical protein KA005_05775 [bacterium]|nr:hypothetical protein [bacterium]
MPDNYIPVAEIAVDALLAILKNPAIDIKDPSLPDIAVNHAKALLESLNGQPAGKNH